MARPLSMDLRERVVARRRAGESIRAVASVFEIAPSTVSKWTQRWHETGDVKPAKFGGYRRRLLEPYRETVHALVAAKPHCSVKELQGELARSEEHTSELKYLMRISYAVFCLKKKK